MEPPAHLFLNVAEAASRWMRDKLGRSQNRKADCLSESGGNQRLSPLRGERGPRVDCKQPSDKPLNPGFADGVLTLGAI